MEAPLHSSSVLLTKTDRIFNEVSALVRHAIPEDPRLWDLAGWQEGLGCVNLGQVRQPWPCWLWLQEPQEPHPDLLGTSEDLSAHRRSLPAPTPKGTVVGTGGPCPGCLCLAKWE